MAARSGLARQASYISLLSHSTSDVICVGIGGRIERLAADEAGRPGLGLAVAVQQLPRLGDPALLRPVMRQNAYHSLRLP